MRVAWVVGGPKVIQSAAFSRAKAMVDYNCCGSDVTMGFYMLLFGETVVAEAEASHDYLRLKLIVQVTAAVVAQK